MNIHKQPIHPMHAYGYVQPLTFYANAIRKGHLYQSPDLQ